MEKVILSMADLVKTFKEHEELFSFYPDGIRGLIKDTILNSIIPEESLGGDQGLARKAFKEKVTREYVNSAQAVMLFNGEHTNELTYVEYIADLIDCLVGDILISIFLNTPIHIVNIEECTRWVGDDLMIRVKRLNAK